MNVFSAYGKHKDGHMKQFELQTDINDPSRYLAQNKSILQEECRRISVKWPLLVLIDCSDSIEEQPSPLGAA